MSAFRAFMIYDYQRSFFFLFIRRGFQVSPKWNECRKGLETKLQEMVKEPKDAFEQSSPYGVFKCKYDKKNKCYFILLSSNEVQEVFQNSVLDEIYKIIEKAPNYSKQIKKEELEQKESETIQNLLETKENEYIKKYGKVKPFEESNESKANGQNQQKSMIQSQPKVVSQINGKQNQRPPSQLQNASAIYNQSQGINSDKDLSSDTLIKIFRCFLMWDYNRQFFFMFIRKGFPIDKIWSQERVKLENQLRAKQLDPNDPKAKPKEPPELFDYRGNFGQYKAKYDKKAKCYFILLSRFKIKEDPQIKLLDALYNEIQKVDKYITVISLSQIQMKYDDLESKKKGVLEKIIDEHEKEAQNQVNQRFIDTKVIESKLGILQSPERNPQRDSEESVSPQNGRVSINDTSQKQIQMLNQNQTEQTQQQESRINNSKLQQQKSIFNQQQQPQEFEQQKEKLQTLDLQEAQGDPDPSAKQDNLDLNSNQDDPEAIPINTEDGLLAQRISLYYTKPLNVSQYIKSGN
ncbi:unnamed protein product (macronuclear) [Paramecium tetraurelia]|uniref:Uncharacterized protein n=1 Tax=Paramecium tetraurelia TaxID=5888 RepID=A0C0E2_PARTE|nr:uncharacterized protein GSPATT00006112001 [Paramecium tetraurelia]CAK64259.1 unnamed protein product [Paramecium tetraurelia]|eukprot:XP_001431657.1 hypothetical protein (macronuclear) [Paramecium tetraurelia strain d4-2]